MDDHSLTLLEFNRVTASVAEHAASERARARLLAWRPIPNPQARSRECRDVAEAIRRTRESGDWCEVGESDIHALLEIDREQALDGEALVAVRGWLDAARRARAHWEDADEEGARFPGLLERISALPDLGALAHRLFEALESDGRVSDAASPALRRSRAEIVEGERALEKRLSSWARGFGENAYVTRHGERFVALVPASGFSRKRGIVHDVSGSGQSLFVEPLEACESNNRLLEQRAVAAEEERRVLRELSGAVLDERERVLEAEEGLVALDTLRARARWAIRTHAVALDPGGERLRLVQARHPLLALAHEADVVPLDLELGREDRLLLVSGPNMGGKTIVLKTVGLAVACAHAAFPVPAAEGSAVPQLEDVIVDLGDEQSVDQGLSTFAAHLQRLAQMARDASPKHLLLVDELGAGTDPEEGAALGRALIEHFASRGAWGVMTSHLGSLKRVAGEVEGVVNGSMEFDMASLSPRFRFLPGIPGASHALSVAERLGFPPDLVARARAMTPDESRALERLISDLHDMRRSLEEERSRARESAARSEAAAGEHERATEVARQSLEALRRRLTSESEALLARARELWQTVQREARRAEKSRAGAEQLRASLESAERGIEEIQHEVDRALPEHARVALPPEAIGPGRRVRVTDLDVEADVVAAPDAEGKVVLQRGSWTIHSHVSRLAPAAAAAKSNAARAGATWESGEEAPPLEIDLRGMEVDEALGAVDVGLDRAVLAGLGELRIIHGIGKGILRAAVERHLKDHPQVLTSRLGEGHEGGRGATVARLR